MNLLMKRKKNQRGCRPVMVAWAFVREKYTLSVPRMVGDGVMVRVYLLADTQVNTLIDFPL